MLAFSPITLWSLQGQTQTLGHKMLKEGLVVKGAEGLCHCCYHHKGKEAVLLLLWEGKEGEH